MNNIFEAEKIEPEPTFENIINEFDNHLKSIASTDMNISTITSFDKSFIQIV